jgi:hypothetical protein
MKSPFVVIFLFLSFISNAQLTIENKLEIPTSKEFNNPWIIDFGKAGFILIKKKTKVVQSSYEWVLEKYDANIKSVKTGSYTVRNNQSLRQKFKTSTHNYSFYLSSEGKYTLVSVGIQDLEISKFEGKIDKKAYVFNIVVLGNNLLIKGTLKRKPFLEMINLKSGVKKPVSFDISGVNTESVYLGYCFYFEELEELLVVANVKNEMEKHDLYILKFNHEGERIGTIHFNKGEADKNYQNISCKLSPEGKYLLSGTYSSDSENTSEGLFFCQIDEEVDFFKLHNFDDFESMQEENKNISGGEIATIEIKMINGSYVFLGEVYYRTYRTELYESQNGTYTTIKTKQIFEGNKFTNSLLCAFNDDGDLLWDNQFDLSFDEKPWDVNTFVTINELEGNLIELISMNKNTIYSKLIDLEGAVTESSPENEIVLGYKEDKSKSTFTFTRHWYDQYFISSGIQERKDDTEVFYITLLKMD